MRKHKAIYKNSIVSIFVCSFIVLYFLFLINTFIITNNFEIPIVLLIGFGVIIVIIFIFFNNLIHSETNEILFNFKGINENLTKIILMLLMITAIFIPPISFSETIIDWNQIGFFNYFRAIVFLIGCAFLPGACIFKIMFPKSTLHEKFNVEPFLLKMTIYPLLSFTFLEICTFIIDIIGLNREVFTIILFLIILILFLLDLLIQKYRDNSNLKFNGVDIKISKYSLLILFMAIGIIIIALGINLSARYSVPGDAYNAIMAADSVGRSDHLQFRTSGAYWGYFSFSLSVLSGIPYININAMLFPFLYLFITSMYLFMKAILYNLNEIYAIISTIFAVTFSGLFYIFNSDLGENNISWIIFDGIFFFRYKSFAFFLLLISMALFIITAKTSKGFVKKFNFLNEELIIIILGAWFLLQSTIHYFIPIIPGISLITIYCIFSKKKNQDIKFFLNFFLFFNIGFILFDILSSYFFSYTSSTFLFSFLGLSQIITDDILAFLNAILTYSILIGFLFTIFLIYKVNIKIYSKGKKRSFSFKINPRSIFILFLIIFSIFFVGEILFKVLIEMDQILESNINFFAFYLDLIFTNIGIIGILGIYLVYFCFKKHRQLFYILLLWLIFLFGLASILIFRRWLQYPFTPPQEISEYEYFYMMYWFDRIWYYSIIPLSIFSSIGLIDLIKYLKSKRYIINSSKILRRIPILIFTSIIIFLSLSNTIIAGVDWYNKGWYLNNEEAQILGWVSKNIPTGSNILIDSHNFRRTTNNIAKSRIYWIDREVNEAIENSGCSEYADVIWHNGSNCGVVLVEELDNHKNVIKIDDQSDKEYAYIKIKFNSAQEYGTFEFFVRTSNMSKSFWMDLCSINPRTHGISFTIMHNAFYYYNGSIYKKIRDIENDKWYQYRIDFECTDGNYMGLKKNRWKATINGTEFGEYIFWNDVDNLGELTLSSSAGYSGWCTFFDKFNFSWAPDFIVENCVFKYPIVINHLKSKNIQYYIHKTKEANYYKREAEKSINIENELIPKFYKEKLYEYGEIIVYYAPYFE